MERETKHTPGPWTLRGVRDPDRIQVVTDAAGSSLVVATVEPLPAGSPVDTLATAHLIAAAPDLLAVVAEFVTGNTTPETWDRARAALQRAGVKP